MSLFKFTPSTVDRDSDRYVNKHQYFLDLQDDYHVRDQGKAYDDFLEFLRNNMDDGSKKYSLYLRHTDDENTSVYAFFDAYISVIMSSCNKFFSELYIVDYHGQASMYLEIAEFATRPHDCCNTTPSQILKKVGVSFRSKYSDELTDEIHNTLRKSFAKSNTLDTLEYHDWHNNMDITLKNIRV